MPSMPKLRQEIFDRDRYCIAWIQSIDEFRLAAPHQCRNQFGDTHKPDDRRWLTLDHVKEQLMMGRKAPTDAAHLVAACWETNVSVPSKRLRAFERAYLAKLYPEVWNGNS